MSETIPPHLAKTYKAFFNASLEGGIQKITQTLYDLLGYPVIVANSVANRICQIPDTERDDPDWNYMLHEGAAPSPHFKDIYDRFLCDKRPPIPRNTPMLINHGFYENRKQLYTVITCKDQIIGLCSLIIDDKEPSAEDMQIIRIYIRALQAELSKAKSEQLYITKNKAQRFINILSVENTDSEELIKDTSILSDFYHGKYQLILTKSRDETDRQGIKEIMFRICFEIMKASPESISTVYGDTIVTLCSGITLKDAIQNEISSFKLFEQHCPSVIEVLKNYPVCSSVSTIYSNMEQTNDMHLQTKMTMKIGMSKSPDSNFFFFKDWLPLQVFGFAAEYAPLELFLHPIINEIYRYDKENHTNFIETLRVLTLNMFNKTLTAQDLYIHSNTLAYRLNKINQVFSIDFNDPLILRTLLCNFLMLESAEKNKR